MAAGVEELLLCRRQLADAAAREVDRDLQSGPAVQRARVAAELDPARRRLAHVAEHHDRLAVLLDPAAQAGPPAEECLVGQFDGGYPRLGMPVEGEQARLGPPVDDRVGGPVGENAGNLGAGDAAARGLTLRADHDEPLEHLPDR